jgi:hypothetical protein
MSPSRCLSLVSPSSLYIHLLVSSVFASVEYVYLCVHFYAGICSFVHVLVKVWV